MTLVRCAIALVMVLAGSRPDVLQHSGAKREPEDGQSKIAGVWRGHSECAVKNSPCHDEVNVYRFAKIAGKPNAFSVTASKVVDGTEIVMGSGEWKYHEKKRIVESTKPSIQLTVEGDRMEGALRIADGTVFRRIYLKKESRKPTYGRCARVFVP